jgi:hypothetical protein
LPHHAELGTRSQAAEWMGAGLLVAYAVVLFAHREAPGMTDYANWTYQGVLLARHLRGLPDPAHLLKPYPVPNSLATLGIGVLALVLPWLIAAKFWLCLQMLAMFAALRHLARTINASVWLVVPQAVFLGVNWWYGFVNFELGCAWILLLASLLMRRVDAGRARDWPIGVLLLLTFLTHMIPFAFAGLLVLLYARQTRRWRTLWQLVPATLLSVWYLAGRFLLEGNADGHAGMVSSVRNYSAAFWAYKANSYAKSFGFVNPNGEVALRLFGRPLFLALFAVSGLLCALLAWSMIQAARRASQVRAPERFLWIAIALILPLYLFAPGTALGVSDPGSRVLQTGLALGLVLCFRESAWVSKAAATCGAMLSVAGLVLFIQFGFGAKLYQGNPPHVPKVIAEFAHVPNHDQDYFYRALEREDFGEPVFPTGIFLNRISK